MPNGIMILGALVVICIASSTKVGRADARQKLSRVTIWLAPLVVAFWAWVAWLLSSAPVQP